MDHLPETLMGVGQVDEALDALDGILYTKARSGFPTLVTVDEAIIALAEVGAAAVPN